MDAARIKHLPTVQREEHGKASSSKGAESAALAARLLPLPALDESSPQAPALPAARLAPNLASTPFAPNGVIVNVTAHPPAAGKGANNLRPAAPDYSHLRRATLSGGHADARALSAEPAASVDTRASGEPAEMQSPASVGSPSASTSEARAPLFAPLNAPILPEQKSGAPVVAQRGLPERIAELIVRAEPVIAPTPRVRGLALRAVALAVLLLLVFQLA